MLEGKDNPSRTLSFAFRNPLPEHERHKPEPPTTNHQQTAVSVRIVMGSGL